MLSAIVFASVIFACQATDYVTSKFSETYVSTSRAKVSMSLSMDVTSNVVTLTMLGPSDAWYSVGFDSSSMADTYCVVVDGEGEVSERYLVGKTEGNELEFTWNIESNTVDGSYRTVVLTREYDYELGDYYHKFQTSYSKLKTIYAYGTDSQLNNHGQDKRGNKEIKATRSSAKAQAFVSKLWTSATDEIYEAEYETYLTTSNVLTWITCIITLGVFAYLAYKHWLKTRYEPIPDECKSNISMVRMGASQQEEQQV